MDLIIESILGQVSGNFKGLIFGFVHVAIMIVGYYTGFSINKFLKILSNGYVAGIFGVVLSHIIADIIACYLDPDLRKMIFGVVIGGDPLTVQMEETTQRRNERDAEVNKKHQEGISPEDLLIAGHQI